MEYVGRGQWECVIVVDGREGRLNPRYDLANHSPDGFAWGYPGSGPAQLALAILANHMKHVSPERLTALKTLAGWNGEDDEPPMLGKCSWEDWVALRFYQAFKARVISRIPSSDGFTLTTAQVDEALDALPSRA